MQPLNLKDVLRYVEENIGSFHQKRIASLDALNLSKVIKRKNPYLFRAKHMLTSEQIVKGLVDAHISSNEETIFGDWLEGLAIFICGKVYSGWKSGILGIDLGFNKDGKRYIVNIKSGPNWANKSQKDKMLSEFMNAKRTMATSNSKVSVVAVNGCCCGKDKKPHKFPENGGDYYKYCCQDFWEFISGKVGLFKDIINSLGHKAKEKNEDFSMSYAHMVNKFTKEFSNQYCNHNGSINWELIVGLNSGKNK